MNNLPNKFTQEPSLNCKKEKMFGFNQKGKVYQVEEIIDEAVIENEPHYLIKWQNHGHQYDTWQPLSILGNISDYLTFWLKQRKTKNQQSKQKKNSVNYNTIKDFIDRENLQPKKKTVRQQYVEEDQLEKKKQKRQRFGAKLLKRQKIWEKYTEKDEKCIDLIEVDQTQNIQKPLENKKARNNLTQRFQAAQNLLLIEKKNKLAKMQEQQPGQQEQQLKSQYNDKLKVICSIDVNEITKICKIFDWKGIMCVQIQMSTGQHYNMTQQELFLSQPQLLQQFKAHMNN